MSRAHSNPKWTKLAQRRRAIGKANDEPCISCGQPIDYTKRGSHPAAPVADHPHPLAWDGDLLPPIEELNVMHVRCSQKQGGRVTAAKRRLRAVPTSATSATIETTGVDLSGGEEGSARSLPVRVSMSREVPQTLSSHPRDPGERDGLPRFFSPPHPEAVASRGDEMVAFAEKRRGAPLRWFQWATAQRRYEVKADGSWCWPLVFESVARQQGKSVTLGEDAAWYASQTTGPELLLHAAHRVRTSLKVQSLMWHWAEAQGYEVRRLLGDSHIIWPNGSDWQTIALESAYGAPAHRLLADEAWALDPVKFWNSLFPTLGDRENPQVLMWSTANPDDRGLVTDLRSDPQVCRMEWGALPGEDVMDPAVWQASSAYWGPGREALMRMAATKPGFDAEWLNVWPDLSRGQTRSPFPNWGSLPVVDGEPPFGCLVALDEHVGGSGAAVAAYHDGGFWYRDVADVRSAVLLAKAWTDREVLVGYSLKTVVEGMALPHSIAYGAKETALGTPLLLEAVREGSIAHEHQENVSAQFEGMRTRMSDAGVMSLSVRDSAAPVIAGKLLGWCLWFERNRPTEVPAVW